MRPERTDDEDAAVVAVLEFLENAGESWAEDPAFTDAPDLVLVKGDERVACEISRIALKELYQWSNDPRYQLDYDKLDEIVVPREADVWLRNVIQDKNRKVANYLQKSDAQSAWLIVHGSFKDDVFDLERDTYDIALLQEVAAAKDHQFDRIFAMSPLSRSNQFVQVLPKSLDVAPSASFEPDCGYLTVTIRMNKTTPLRTGGVHRMRLGGTTDRSRELTRLRPRS